MTYRSVHRVSQQFAGSIVVRPTDWKWIDIAFITESLNSFSLTLGYQWYQFDMIWYTSIIHAMCSEVELWLLTRCHWWIGINQTSQIQHNEQIICGHCTYYYIILLILINLGQAGLSLSFARSFGMYFVIWQFNGTVKCQMFFFCLLWMNVWNWLGSKTYCYFDLRRYVWSALQQHWKQQLLEILILKQFWLQY